MARAKGFVMQREDFREGRIVGGAEDEYEVKFVHQQ